MSRNEDFDDIYMTLEGYYELREEIRADEIEYRLSLAEVLIQARNNQ